MSEPQITKVISIRIPGKYFRRLGFLSYHTGRLPSETARQIIIGYLNHGCVMCGGPTTDWQVFDAVADCVDPECVLLAELDFGMTELEDFSDRPNRYKLPGFS